MTAVGWDTRIFFNDLFASGSGSFEIALDSNVSDYIELKLLMEMSLLTRGISNYVFPNFNFCIYV